MLDRRAAGKHRNLEVEKGVFQIRKSTFPENRKTLPAETRNRKNASRRNPESEKRFPQKSADPRESEIVKIYGKSAERKNASRKNPETEKRFPQKPGIGKTLPAETRNRKNASRSFPQPESGNGKAPDAEIRRSCGISGFGERRVVWTRAPRRRRRGRPSCAGCC